MDITHFWVGYGVVSGVLVTAYVLLMTKYFYFWKRAKTVVLSKNEPKTSVSVLISARNEAENIENCLKSILKNSFPTSLLQIIVIDDHSEDATFQIVENFIAKMPPPQYPGDFFEICVLKNEKTGKKAAIETAMKAARGVLIVTTDADCLVPEHWLRLLTQVFESENAKFIAAPVLFVEEKNAFESFQSLDFLGLMGITSAGIEGGFLHMCNGANLAYPRAIFEEMNGFEGIKAKASGDDMLLLQKIARRYRKEISYVKTPLVCVRTHAKPTFSSFLSQRIRWASKSGDYPARYTTVQLAFVFLLCINIFISLTMSLLQIEFFYLFLIQIFLKSLIDFIFLRDVSHYFGRKDLIRFNNFFYNEILHIIYIALVGTLANIQTTYEWKGRRVR